MKKPSTDKKTADKTAKKPQRPEDDLALFPEFGTESWIEEDEGKLAVDVQETGKDIIIRSAIAGIKPEDLELSVHNDMLTIRGNRHIEEEKHDGNWLIRECHWGAFSRSLILPTEIDADSITAELKNGILTVKLPKVIRDKKIEVIEK